MNVNIRRRSAVWNYFTIVSGDPKKVKCTTCKAMMSFKNGSTLNLLRHIKAKHPTEYKTCCKLNQRLIQSLQEAVIVKKEPQLDDKEKLEDQAFDFKNVEENGEEDGDNLQLLAKLSSKRKRSEIWLHFSESEKFSQKFPERAKCKHCNGIVSYKGGSLGNLLRHLKNKHPSVQCARRGYSFTSAPNIPVSSPNSPYESDASDLLLHSGDMKLLKKLSSKRKRSEIWLHFSESKKFSPKSSERAKCKHCDGIVCYTGGSTGNLLRHLKTKHPSVQCARRDYPFTSVPNIPVSSPNSPSESDASDLLLHSGDMEQSNECPDQNQLDDLKRATNFTLNEKIVLVRLAKKYIRLIECKKMDVLSKQMKQIAWTNIEYEFNMLSRENNRDKKVLRKKYENMKVRIKEKYEAIAKKETPEFALSKLNNVERDVIDLVQNCEKYATDDNQEVTVEDPIHIEYLNPAREEFSSYTDTVEELATIVEEFETVDEHSTSSAEVSTILQEAEYVFSHDENEGIQESEPDESPKKDPIDLESGLESATKTTTPQEPSLSPFMRFKNDARTSKPKRGENFKTVEQMEISNLDMNRFLGTRTKYIKLQKRCLVIEHCQKMKFQAALHKEKMQLIQLQQELLRKQIQVEEQKLRKDE